MNLADYFRINNMTYQAVIFATGDEACITYDGWRLRCLTATPRRLYAERLRASNPDDHNVLPEIISKEPLGPAVRHGDNHWADIVRWTHMAMLNAEELA